MSETTYLFLSLLSTNLLVYIIFILTPRFSNTSTYMGVLLAPKYRDTETIKNITKGFIFKTTLVFSLSLLVSVLLLFLLPQSYRDFAIAIPLIIQMFLYFVIFAQSNKKVLAYKKSLNLEEVPISKVLIDTSFMEQKNKIKQFYKKILLFLLGVAILLFIYSLIQYEKMPGLIPTHFNFLGKADSWTDKNLITALFPSLFLIIIICIFRSTLNTTFMARNNLSKEQLESRKDFILIYLSGVARSLVLMTIALTLIMTNLVIATVKGQDLNPFCNYIFVILLVISLILMFYNKHHYHPRFSSKVGENPALAPEDQDDYWLWGIIYNNPNDPAFLVNKRYGMGWTINLGTPKGKLFILAIFITIICAIISSI